MILVVDDHVDTAEVLVGLLGKAGHDATAVYSGEQLLEHLERSETAPRLIVLDMAMPGMGGMECLRRIASHPRWRDIPVVVYSADYTFSAMRQAVSLGAKEYLVKGTVAWDAIIEAVTRHAGADDAPPSTSAP
jgi:CheY-like chemotaxis protein